MTGDYKDEVARMKHNWQEVPGTYTRQCSLCRGYARWGYKDEDCPALVPPSGTPTDILDRALRRSLTDVWTELDKKHRRRGL